MYSQFMMHGQKNIKLPLKFLGLLPCCSNFRHYMWYHVLHKQTR